ncbi:uncharacterized protein EHS24_000997 [Apiotrichum porosum]|uniref:Uncharacterized protein n=1 Tax=Apiotrichum porosum TaxID=105984 RepID=A0A427YBI7_9TREE|nr:uncharacterized protein EHS24_000997 [Apiotrichum porosum]RSH88452.1 hypothetical protein EHS24_000997 [Apiotrichum porosum]
MSPAKDLLVHLGWETVFEDVVLYLCFTSQFSAFVIVLTGIGPSARPLERTIGLATILTSFAALALLVETGVYLSADTDTLIAILLFLLAILALILVALNGMYSVVNRSSGDINLV